MQPTRRVTRTGALACLRTGLRASASPNSRRRVDDLGGLLANLRAAGVEVLKGPESHENGDFAWIADPDGNKVQLWEPKLWDETNKAE
jgi:hypothetical protein